LFASHVTHDPIYKFIMSPRQTNCTADNRIGDEKFEQFLVNKERMGNLVFNWFNDKSE